MVLFRLALLTQVSIAGDCAFAGQRCHFAGEDLGQLQVSQFAGDCVHLQGGRCSTQPGTVASRWRLGDPLGGGFASLLSRAGQEAGEPQACNLVKS